MSTVQADHDTLRRAEELKPGEFIYLHPIDVSRDEEKAYFGRFREIRRGIITGPGFSNPRNYIEIICGDVLKFTRACVHGRMTWLPSDDLYFWEIDNKVVFGNLEEYFLHVGRDGILDGMRKHKNPNVSLVEYLIDNAV